MIPGWKRGAGLAACLLLAPLLASASGISGTVRNTAGAPQMGATVEISALAGGPPHIAFTDDHGRYQSAGLLPGKYVIKATAPSFLPSLRENVVLRAGASLVVNITLNTLFEAISMLPVHSRSDQDEEDWKWTLRSVASRPILRVLDNGPLVVVSGSDDGKDRVLKARVAFYGGSEAEGFASGASRGTAFHLERSLFSAGTISVGGRMGASPNAPSVLRAAYEHEFADGRHPQVAFTVRRFGAPDTQSRSPLTALSLSASDRILIMDAVELRYGGQIESIQYLEHSTAFRPFGALDVHLTPETLFEYRFDTTQPESSRLLKGFDSAPRDLSESGPRMSLVDYDTRLEHARHHEISLSRRLGAANTVQFAAFSDSISNMAGLGVGNVSAGSPSLLPDYYSDTFNYNAGDFSTRGLRAGVQHRFTPSLTSSFTYSYGGALTLASPNAPLDQALDSFSTVNRHAMSAKLAGRVPHTGTRWITSYKWTSGRALSPVDAFNASAGASDPFFNLFIRQPVSLPAIFPGQMEVLVDVRNLLAQGYVPVIGADGHTLYLVQSARSVRGGLSFSF